MMIVIQMIKTLTKLMIHQTQILKKEIILKMKTSNEKRAKQKKKRDHKNNYSKSRSWKEKILRNFYLIFMIS